MLLIGAIVVEVAGSLCLKGALTYPMLYVPVVIAYVSAFTLLAFVLRTGMPLGVAYGIWGASGVVLTAILSLLIFGEQVNLLMGIGIVIVVAGVLCVQLGSHRASRTMEFAS